jgi:hypothetical protein
MFGNGWLGDGRSKSGLALQYLSCLSYLATPNGDVDERCHDRDDERPPDDVGGAGRPRHRCESLIEIRSGLARHGEKLDLRFY